MGNCKGFGCFEHSRVSGTRIDINMAANKGQPGQDESQSDRRDVQNKLSPVQQVLCVSFSANTLLGQTHDAHG